MLLETNVSACVDHNNDYNTHLNSYLEHLKIEKSKKRRKKCNKFDFSLLRFRPFLRHQIFLEREIEEIERRIEYCHDHNEGV
ncbi:hypothetical protein [Fluviispira vulneris]|uniref:hypothetical protein n=1 Tax=Fluviispira vulneris TaxID=2763012 RepID=UPI0016491C8E|nr:hypothetical protein [Fluviispira vulneris]